MAAKAEFIYTVCLINYNTISVSGSHHATMVHSHVLTKFVEKVLEQFNYRLVYCLMLLH